MALAEKVLDLCGTVELGDKELFGHPKIVPYPYEVNWQIGHLMVA